MKNNHPLFELNYVWKVMKIPNYANRFLEMLPEEIRLVYQAKSGDIRAFVKLYDAYVERVYRYIHFLAPNNGVAEGLTFQVFFKAWEYFDHYKIFGLSFMVWLYSVARNQVNAYYRTHKEAVAPDNDFRLTLKGDNLSKEFQVIRDGLHFLTAEQQQVLILKFIVGVSNKNIARIVAMEENDIRILQMHGLQALTEHLNESQLSIDTKDFQGVLEGCLTTLSSGASTLDECLEHYPEYTAQLSPLLETALLLNLGRDIKPLSTFNMYTQGALNQYVYSHPRQQKILRPVLQRTALTFAVLVATFLVTGTAQAQSALPGEPLYTWKRTSEQAWRALSPDQVTTDIALANRRLNEWIAVSDDPKRNTSAMTSYLEVVSRLEESTDDSETLTLIVPALQSHQEILNEAGLPATQLNNYLATVASPTPTAVPTYVIPTSTSTSTPVPTETQVATEIPPTETEVPPTETEVPTPTEVPPTETETATPTEIPPTETEVPTPTEVPPTETDIPAEIVPTVEPTSTPTPDIFQEIFPENSSQ